MAQATEFTTTAPLLEDTESALASPFTRVAGSDALTKLAARVVQQGTCLDASTNSRSPPRVHAARLRRVANRSWD